MSAYSCNPYGVSESLAAFNWLNILIKRYNITLLTTDENKKNIESYHDNKLPKHLDIIPFSDCYPYRKKKLIHESLKVGYFLFNHKIHTFLKRNLGIVNCADILYHKSPSGFRYYSNLYHFKKPYVFGPTGGGLHPPAALKDFFAKEHPLFRLRKLDRYILRSPIYRAHYRAAMRILITLEYVRDVLGKEYDDKYYELFDTGIDTKMFQRDGEVAGSDPVSILYVGKLTRYKGAELLLRGYAGLSAEKRQGSVVDIVGDGEEQSYLRGLAEDFGIKEKVNFHGFVTRKKVIEYYKKASIFCFPTITEASGNSLLEAMSFGLPIITVDNGGPKYMCHASGSFKVAIDSVDEMVEELSGYLNTLIDDRQLRTQMGAVNRKHCETHYDWSILEKNIYQFFDSLA
jgi:glycosyltransferase involved in cell wall biosynthesis